MKKIVKISKKGKVKDFKGGLNLDGYNNLPVETKVAFIKELIPLGLMHIRDVLYQEVEKLTGNRYARGKKTGARRWGSQPGSVNLLDHHYGINVPRVRDVEKRQEIPLKSYGQFKETSMMDEMIFKRILHGLSCSRYEECASLVPGAFGLKGSSVSRRFINASKKKLQELMTRDLSSKDIIAVFIDGKAFGEDEIITALGITIEGEKVVLGIIQSATENYLVMKDFINSLIERGLRYDRGLLIVIDGAKGIRKAVDDCFGEKAVVQRCQWHKRENVLSYLPKNQKENFKRKLICAYNQPTYEDALTSLNLIRKELTLINQSAVRSLDEGLEETLTIHRLGLINELKRSFTTTNILESIHAQVEHKTDRVDYWKNSSQKHRWVASALLFIEKGLNRVNGYKYLPDLQQSIAREIKLIQEEVKAA